MQRALQRFHAKDLTKLTSLYYIPFPYVAKPVRFEVMDTSGNRPIIKIRQSRENPVTHEVNDNDVIKLKKTSDNEVVVEVKVTGYVTQVDII